MPPVFTAVANKQYDRLTLHPNNLKYELQQPARIAPNALLDIAYGQQAEELRSKLTYKGYSVPVYAFAYDWRQALEFTEEKLREFVLEVIQRTMLTAPYAKDNGILENQHVNLVCHSMGGLIAAGYIERYKKKPST